MRLQHVKDSVTSTIGDRTTTLIDNGKEQVENFLRDMPDELKPFIPAFKCAISGDFLGAAGKVIYRLLPLVAIALLIVIVAFVIKWWLGLISIPVVVVWLIFKVLTIVNGIRKFMLGLPKEILMSIKNLI